MDLFIIRHAQSHNNTLADQRDRVVDPPLTHIGRQQAQCVAEFVAHGLDSDLYSARSPASSANGHGLGITRLYASAMLRALDTANAIALETRLQPRVWLDIHEEGGMWLANGDERGIAGHPGLTRAEVAARFPDFVLPEGLTESGWWTTGLEASDASTQRAERVAQTLRTMATEWPDDRIAIVTHGGFGAALLKAIFHVPVGEQLFFYHNNTGISKIRFRHDGRLSMRYLNRVGHLPAELIT